MQKAPDPYNAFIFVLLGTAVIIGSLAITTALAARNGDSSNEESTGCLSAVSSGTHNGIISSGGNDYELEWFVPSSHDADPLPLVLSFHGLSVTGNQFAAFTEILSLAETESFIVAHPTGLAVSDTDSRPSWEVGGFERGERNDVAMVDDLIDQMADTTCVDRSRVYVMGMSNGGLFVGELVCELSDRIAGAASVAGTAFPDDCAPSRPVPYIAFHGLADNILPWSAEREAVLAGAPEFVDTFDRPIPDEFIEFTDEFQCNEIVEDQPSELIIRTTYAVCGEATLEFYAIGNGGHSWPGSPSSAISASLGETNMDINATQLIWQFFDSQ